MKPSTEDIEFLVVKASVLKEGQVDLARVGTWQFVSFLNIHYCSKKELYVKLQTFVYGHFIYFCDEANALLVVFIYWVCIYTKFATIPSMIMCDKRFCVYFYFGNLYFL